MVCLSKLPPFRPAVLKLLNISSDSGTAIPAFEEVFKGDPALTADLLLVANSALFGNRAQIATIRHALAYLGLERVRALASTIAVGFFVRNQPRSGVVRQIWEHSIAAAVIAENLGGLSGLPDLYTAGLTHDLGRLGLLLAVGPPYDNAMSAAFADYEEAAKAEISLVGMDHGEAGSVVGRRWTFPPVLYACMSEHHKELPMRIGDPLWTVQLACRMAGSLGYPEVRLAQAVEVPELPEILRTHTELASDRLQALIATQLEAVGA